MTDKPNAARGALLGAFVGDAAGATLEMMSRAPTEAEVQRAMAMVGGGIWNTAPGQITDDGEMTVALSHALAGQAQYDPQRAAYQYRKWRLSNPFDVGITTNQALGRGDLDDKNLAQCVLENALAHNTGSLANGSLMRASALGVWSATVSVSDAVAAARLDAQLTHPNAICQWAGAAYVVALRHLLLHPGDAQGAVAAARAVLAEGACAPVLGWLDEAQSGQLPAFAPQIGFIRIAFTHAFYHLWRTTDYAAALHQVLLGGGDTDTNACIVGALLGALHGAEAIPLPMRQAVLQCDTRRCGCPRPDWLHPRCLPLLQ